METQHKMKADILGFGKEFYRKYPKQWKQNRKSLGSGVPGGGSEIDVEAHIRRQGYINKPGGMPEERGEGKVRWGAFFATTVIVALIILYQWPRMKQNPKKDKLAFITLLLIGWVLSMFDLPT